jgi:hypothetical protein
MDSEDKFAIAALAIGCAATLGLIGFSLVSCGNEINATIEAEIKAAQDVSPAIEHANGCPLDAIEYDAPAFASGGKALKVTDRFSKSEWWLVKVGGEWVSLPIESEEAGK